MNQFFCQISLFIWLPIVVGLFVTLPTKKAVVVAYVTAWLALPNIGFNIPGLPNYTKMTATVTGVLVCMLIFDQVKVFSLRFRWYDLPLMVWCITPFFSALTNNLGAYEGFSATLDALVSWGLPYLIGRVYITDLEGVRDLAIGIAIGGIVYVPLCLFEIRFSPILERIVYGIVRFEPMRYGGYRPKVFLTTGLELGMWMSCASVLCYQLWACGSLKTLRGIPASWFMLILLTTTVLCKSTGSIMLAAFGIVSLWTTRRLGRSWFVWVAILISPLYTFTRTFDLWSGREVLEIADATVGGDRAQSYEYRLMMEKMLASHALDRPFFGWGRFNRSQVTSKDGRVVSVPDGYWIISLGSTGLIGLTSLIVMMTLPMVLMIRRFPVSTWKDPRVCPAISLAFVLVMIMLDFLSNAMPNPIYALIMGGLVGQSAVRLAKYSSQAETSLAEASEYMKQGQTTLAADAFRQAIEFSSDGTDLEGRRVQAEALDGLGQSFLTNGLAEEAEHAFREALLVRDWLAAQTQDPLRYRDLAIARESLSRTLAGLNRTDEAIEERKIALQIWDILTTDAPRNADFCDHRLNALNDLAWLLVTDSDPSMSKARLAVQLAEEALSTSAAHFVAWNTLGVARYRSGDWTGAIEALEHSALSTPDRQGTAFDHYFLAMAWTQLQHQDLAREWLERGIAWYARNRTSNLALERFRQEAEMLMTEGNPQPSLGHS